jgi:predicted RNA-binding protein associated with RNAse of E/G family
VSLDRRVRIHYLRPPQQVQIFDQRLVLDRDDVKVTLAESMPFDPPMRIAGQIVLEHGSDVVWFTFPELWHDIGRFHRADGTFTGLYANILTPPELTDDVWLPPGGKAVLLDADELDEALGREWIDRSTANRARAEADRLMSAARAGSWPPPVVNEWTLDRCRAELRRERT